MRSPPAAARRFPRRWYPPVSAAIVARCPDCAKGLKLKPSAAGKRVKCPACGAAVDVPGGAANPGGDAKAAGRPKRKPAPAAPRSGNSGELFTGLNLGELGHDGGAQTALPGRVRKGGSTAEIPVAAAPGGKKPDKPPTPLPVVLGAIGGSLLLLAAVGGTAVYLLLNNQPAEPPGDLVRYEHPEPRTFSLDVPSNWAVEAGGGTGGRPAFAKIEGPGAEVDVRNSPRGSAVGDIGAAAEQGGPVGEELPEELTAIFGQHKMTRDQVAGDFSSYEETGGENFDARGGEGRRSVFTASGSFGGAITGLRGTVRVGNETYNVVMRCAPRDFPTLRPVFEKMLDSMGRGG